MKKLFFLLVLILSITACKDEKDKYKNSLDISVYQLFKDGKFTALEKFLPTRAFYKSLGREVEERSEADIDSLISRNNQRLIDSWEKINHTVKENKIDPGKIALKESVLYNPFRYKFNPGNGDRI